MKTTQWKFDDHNLTEDKTLRSDLALALKAAGCLTLDDCYRYLLKVLPQWFVYRGGRHIAIHRSSAWDSPRLLLIQEVA